MPEWLSDAIEMAKPYWPILVQCITFWFVTNNLKKRVFTKARAAGGGFHSFMRSTMWAQPMLYGAAWGALYPWMPSITWITTRGGAVTAGILAGVGSVAGFRLLEAVAEKRGWIPVLKVLREVGSPTLRPPPADE